MCFNDTFLIKDTYIFCDFVPTGNEENSMMERIEEIRHHIRIESAVQDGAQNAIKLLKNSKIADKKPLQEVTYASIFYICFFLLLKFIKAEKIRLKQFYAL